MGNLTEKEDAFGHEIFDYFQHRRGYEIVERDDGYIDVSPNGPAVYFSEYKKWPGHLKKATRFARGKILDIGCGAGRCLLHLQSKGLDAVGIDNSPLMVKTCRLRGAKNVILCSITAIGPRLGIFDTIIMFGNNFGLFGSFKQAKRLLKVMHNMTSGNARILVESAHVYQTNIPEHLAYHKYNRRRGRMAGQLRLRIRYKKYRTPWFDYLLVSQEEMRDIVDGTGWRIRKFIDSPGPAYAAVIEKE